MKGRTERKGWLRAAVTGTHSGRLRARLRGARKSRRGQKARARVFGSRARLRPTAPVRKGRAGLLARFHLLAPSGAVRAPRRHTQPSLPGTRPASPGQRPEHPDSCARRTNKEHPHWLECSNRSGRLRPLLSGRTHGFPVRCGPDFAPVRMQLAAADCCCAPLPAGLNVLFYFALVFVVVVAAVVFYFALVCFK